MGKSGLERAGVRYARGGNAGEPLGGGRLKRGKDVRRRSREESAATPLTLTIAESSPGGIDSISASGSTVEECVPKRRFASLSRRLATKAKRRSLSEESGVGEDKELSRCK